MADTPRVTVPVEDLAGKLKAIRDKFLMPTPDKDFTDYAVMTRCIARLSAAPAPEGGAVSTGAQAVIRNGQIVISVDVDALPLILSGSIALNAVAGTFKVTDAVTFAKEVCYALNAEKEDGTTRVHMMFDSAFNHAIDQGAEGVDEINEDEFEAEAARLQAEAQATREEAPAEAGEREAIARAVRRAVGDAWIGEHQAEVAADAVLALRAQPPAREDALRVAVEALDEMADTDPDEGTSWFHDRANKARADIAALQAEQGAK